MSKWLITSDLQWDCQPNYSTLLPSGITSRLQDISQCWTWLAKLAVKLKCEGIVVVGDIFDSRTTLDLSVLDAACRGFHWAKSAGLKLHVVVGNHDSYLRVPTLNSLQVFRGYAEVHDRPGVDEAMGFGFVPWTDDPAAFAESVGRVAGEARYLFAHVLLEGAVLGAKGGVPLSALQRQKFRHVFLGDVHALTEMAANVLYVGAPMQHDYGDAGQERGVVILDTEKDTMDFVVNTESPRFHVVVNDKLFGVRHGDFVRVKTDDVAVGRKAVAFAQQLTPWVESEIVELPDVKPRLDVRSAQDHKTALGRYCAFKGRTQCAALIERGLSILEEARGVGK